MSFSPLSFPALSCILFFVHFPSASSHFSIVRQLHIHFHYSSRLSLQAHKRLTATGERLLVTLVVQLSVPTKSDNCWNLTHSHPAFSWENHELTRQLGGSCSEKPQQMMDKIQYLVPLGHGDYWMPNCPVGISRNAQDNALLNFSRSIE